MPIVFGAISPHPPIIIPEVGGSETKKVQKTIKALEKLALKLAEKEPDILIVITPHGLVYPDRMNVCGLPKLQGDFGNFGAPQIKYKWENDLKLAYKINKSANKENIPTLLYDNGGAGGTLELDHGVLVPLYYLTQNLAEVKVLPIAYSFLDNLRHFAFGEILAEIGKSENQNIAIIASGDLSHRLIPSAPAGFAPGGKKFDQDLISKIKTKDIEGILNFDEDFVEEAGECGLKSIIILLGALEKLKWQPEILSYEGPFGVGYLVANLKII